MNIYSSTNKLQNDVLNVDLSLLVSIPECNSVIISPKTGDITMLEKAKLRNMHHFFLFACYIVSFHVIDLKFIILRPLSYI